MSAEQSDELLSQLYHDIVEKYAKLKLKHRALKEEYRALRVSLQPIDSENEATRLCNWTIKRCMSVIWQEYNDLGVLHPRQLEKRFKKMRVSIQEIEKLTTKTTNNE